MAKVFLGWAIVEKFKLKDGKDAYRMTAPGHVYATEEAAHQEAHRLFQHAEVDTIALGVEYEMSYYVTDVSVDLDFSV